VATKPDKTFAAVTYPTRHPLFERLAQRLYRVGELAAGCIIIAQA
jgi:hypothetical protein